MPQTAAIEPGAGKVAEHTAFAVRVDGFEGPFDLLLSLIAKHRLEVTALALHQVTDDFVRHLRNQGDGWDLGETTEFLVVAAILLDLKAARLLPGESVEDDEDLALLETRDLLFARLLQYRAFKEASVDFGARLAASPIRVARAGGLDPGLSALLPDVVIRQSAAEFGQLAVRVMTPTPADRVNTNHIHDAPVSVRDQAVLVATRLRRASPMSFRALIGDAPDLHHVVARFLALLELYRDGVIGFEQAGALSDLVVRWTGTATGVITVTDEFDEEISGSASQGNGARTSAGATTIGVSGA